MPAAPFRQRIRSHRMLVRRQRHVHGAVADGVRHHLPAASVEQPHHPVEVVGLDRRRAGRRVVVGVRREHRGRARVDDAVEHDLDRAGLEERIVGVSLRDGVELGDGRFAQHLRQSDSAEYTRTPKSPSRRASAIDLEVRGVAAGVLHAGDAVSVRLDYRRADRAGAVGPRRRRHVTGSRAPSRLLEDAGRFARSRIFHDRRLAAGWAFSSVMPASRRARVFTQRCVAVVADDLRRSIRRPARRAAAESAGRRGTDW